MMKPATLTSFVLLSFAFISAHSTSDLKECIAAMDSNE